MRRGLLVLIVCAASGCDVVFHIDEIPAGGGSAVGDAAPDGVPPVCSLVGLYGAGGAGFVSYCVRTDSSPLLLAGTIDTTANQKCDYVPSKGADADVACVISAKTIDVESLVVTGDKPLVLAALDTITVTGTIDLTGGGGANPPACATSGEGGKGGPSTAGGGGGGGGGGWGTLGGKGGMGKAGTQAPAGAAAAIPIDIRGGCPGGAGGSGMTGAPGKGGAGGGAIYLTAGTAIHVAATGAIDASGGGGTGGAATDGGGGGGGTGGLIAFDSPVVTFDFLQAAGAKLFANGGGGGGGGGMPGKVSVDPASAGAGGLPNGGNGGVGSGSGVAGATDTVGGGGGGGGGQGFIVVFTLGPLSGDASHVSPPLIAGT